MREIRVLIRIGQPDMKGAVEVELEDNFVEDDAVDLQVRAMAGEAVEKAMAAEVAR